jgi:iron(III) transport system ATP-binding protein
VLLDEPFSSLDAALRSSVRADVVRVLRAAGATALLVTHDQDEALSMADHVAVLRDGVIAQAGAPRALYEQPLDLDLARFLGEANVVSGTASAGATTTLFGTVPTHPGIEGIEGGVIVMVRPEQFAVAPGIGADGVRGEVEDLHYFGHDTIMTVRPTEHEGLGVLRVRIVGARTLSPGQTVTVSVTGPVSAWAST